MTRSTQLAKFQTPGEGRVVFLEWSGRDLEEAVCVEGDGGGRSWKKKSVIPPRIQGRGDASGPAGKAEERVAGNRSGERCFPNGSRLTLVCGRVEGTSEFFFFLFHLSFFLNSLSRGAVTIVPLGQLVGKLPLKRAMVCLRRSVFFFLPLLRNPRLTVVHVIYAQLPHFGNGDHFQGLDRSHSRLRWRQNRFF